MYSTNVNAKLNLPWRGIKAGRHDVEITIARWRCCCYNDDDGGNYGDNNDKSVDNDDYYALYNVFCEN